MDSRLKKHILPGHEEDPLYASVLSIDPDSLDVEWLLHPSMFMEACDELGTAEAALARVKLDMERRISEIALDVRVMPESYGLSKTTNDAATNIANTDEDVIALQERMITLQEQVNRKQRAVRAMEHRKTALEELTGLYRSQYYSEPRNDNHQGGASNLKTTAWKERMKNRVIARSSGEQE